MSQTKKKDDWAKLKAAGLLIGGAVIGAAVTVISALAFDQSNKDETLSESSETQERQRNTMVEENRNLKTEIQNLKAEGLVNDNVPDTEVQPGDDATACFICEMHVACIAFQPCGHTKCCKDCSQKLEECPWCRRQITRRQRIFL
eukprot:GHVL01024735.1.p1 GENE.GHVL01024735.1~~GHVL01024735.1.p1  ORF type:complete len:145 (+),score=25.28 GHVL01024735.1:44-478(+)